MRSRIARKIAWVAQKMGIFYVLHAVRRNRQTKIRERLRFPASESCQHKRLQTKSSRCLQSFDHIRRISAAGYGHRDIALFRQAVQLF